MMKTDQPDSKESQQKRNPDFVGAEIAIKRAALKAREIARQHGTAIVTLENGVIKEEYPEKLE